MPYDRRCSPGPSSVPVRAQRPSAHLTCLHKEQRQERKRKEDSFQKCLKPRPPAGPSPRYPRGATPGEQWHARGGRRDARNAEDKASTQKAGRRSQERAGSALHNGAQPGGALRGDQAGPINAAKSYMTANSALQESYPLSHVSVTSSMVQRFVSHSTHCHACSALSIGMEVSKTHAHGSSPRRRKGFPDPHHPRVSCPLRRSSPVLGRLNDQLICTEARRAGQSCRRRRSCIRLSWAGELRT